MDIFNKDQHPFLFNNEFGQTEIVYAKTYEEAIKIHYKNDPYIVRLNYPFNTFYKFDLLNKL